MLARGERRETSLVDGVEGGEPGEVAVDGNHLGVHADGDGSGVRPGDTGTDHDDPARPHPRDAAQQHAPATRGALEMLRPGDRRHPACDLAHRREERERAVGEADRLIGDRRRTSVENRLGAVAGRGEVEVGEKDEPFAQTVEFLRDGLFHLADEFGLSPELIRVGDDPGTDPQVVGVREGGPLAG